MLVFQYQLKNELSGFIHEAIALITLQLLGMLEEGGGCVE
jgi:hypothetical protein